jgi:hypothetical protein
MVHICWEKKKFEKKKVIHFRGLSALKMQKHFLFVSSFENINFAFNEKYSKNFNENPNYYVYFVIFQTYRTVV